MPSAPAGDLAAMVKRVDSVPGNAILQKLVSGDKYAMIEAAIQAGTPDRPNPDRVYEVANEAIFDSLAKSGAFTQLYTGGRGPVYVPPPEESARQ